MLELVVPVLTIIVVIVIVIMIGNYVLKHPEIIDAGHNAAIQICSIDERLYESLYPNINDPWAVEFLDLIKQGEEIGNEEKKYLQKHQEKAVRSLASNMVCKLV